MTGSELRDLRNRHGLSQIEMADGIGTTKTNLSAYERGAKPISDDTADRVRFFLKDKPVAPPNANSVARQKPLSGDPPAPRKPVFSGTKHAKGESKPAKSETKPSIGSSKPPTYVVDQGVPGRNRTIVVELGPETLGIISSLFRAVFGEFLEKKKETFRVIYGGKTVSSHSNIVDALKNSAKYPGAQVVGDDDKVYAKNR